MKTLCGVYLGPGYELTNYDGDVIGSYEVIDAYATPASTLNKIGYVVRVKLLNGEIYEGKSLGINCSFEGEQIS